MQATSDQISQYASGEGVSVVAAGADIAAGLSELATEIDLFRRQEWSQSDDLADEDLAAERPGAPLIGGAFLLGLLAPLLSHAPVLGLVSVCKILLLSAGLAQMMAP